MPRKKKPVENAVREILSRAGDEALDRLGEAITEENRLASDKSRDEQIADLAEEISELIQQAGYAIPRDEDHDWPVFLATKAVDGDESDDHANVLAKRFLDGIGGPHAVYVARDRNGEEVRVRFCSGATCLHAEDEGVDLVWQRYSKADNGQLAWRTTDTDDNDPRRLIWTFPFAGHEAVWPGGADA